MAPIRGRGRARLQCRQWSSLPSELLEMVAQKLLCSFDYVSFRSVCTTWRSATPLIKFAPLMMFPLDATAGTIKFFSPSDDLPFQLAKDYLRDKVLCGLTEGMLVLMDKRARMSLFNPFTGEQISLPPGNAQLALASSGSTVMMVNGEHWVDLGRNRLLITLGEPIGLADMRSFFIKEVVLSPSVDFGGQRYAMATLAASNKVAFCRLGGSRWRLLDTGLSTSVWSVTYCNGRFYAVDFEGDVAFFHVENPVSFTRQCSLPEITGLFTAFKLLGSRGKLMMVALKIFSEFPEEDDRDRYNYEVYRLEETTWVRVTSIGEDTLFVSRHYNSNSQYLVGGVSGYHNSHSQYLEGLQAWKGNCICFPEPTVCFPNSAMPQTVHMEFVDLVDGSKRFKDTGETKNYPETITWFKPNLM
ncbi:F-box protein SKIP23-like [Canna indica]|uniref:F-box protein SKIP23-like n=1 Tax=Canna indica TaxID=4628 RepID=A0AAQ3K3D7_9LILI|nr:F-box protein SKIP23-like [Canna indica]